MRLIHAAVLSCCLSLLACSSGSGLPPDAGSGGCSSARDCPQTPLPQVCVDQGGTSKVCVIVCSKNADCAPGKVCEDGSCTNPGCGGDSDCAPGQICASGACGSAPQASAVGSCAITPGTGVVHVGNKLQLVALVKDGTGAAIPFKGVTWSATGAGTVDAGGLVTGTAPAAGATGTATVTATAGAKTCTATVTTYAATTPMRVVAIDGQTKQPIANAFVVLGSGPWTADTKVKTDASGIALFPNAPAAPRDVHVFASGYNYTSYLGSSGTDLLATLPPYIPLAQRSGFAGSITPADFLKLAHPDWIVHLGFFGSGVANSILDFSLDTLIGPLRSVQLPASFGGKPINLPSGLVFGLGDDLLKTGDYKMYAEPGKRVLWGLGGNVDVATVLPVVTQVGGGNVDVGVLLPKLLPLLGNLQAGSIVGAEVAANVAPGGTPTFTPATVPLNTPLRLKAVAPAPDLPTVDGQYVDGVIALAGASAYPMGFVPLGLTAGISHKDSTNAKTAKVDDPSCDPKGSVPCNTSKLPLKLAAANNGLEGSQYGVVLLALNFGGLTPGSTTGIAVSGLVKLQSEVKFSSGDQPPATIDYGTRGFMKLPNSGVISFSKGSRKLMVNSDADPSVQIYRFELENAARQDWNIWMDKAGAGGRQVTLINPHDVDPSLTDTLADAVPQAGGNPKGASGRMVGIATTDPAQNYATLTGFGNITLDAIGNNLSAFSVATVDLGN